MSETPMFYFGPWDVAGHYLFNEQGRSANDPIGFPWRPETIDGGLQPRGEKQAEGLARLHHKNGWTSLSFWDRSVDRRRNSNSNYFAEGAFTFEQMVEMAKTRFAERWNRMTFEVTNEPKEQSK